MHLVQTRERAKPEGLGHHHISVGQVAADPKVAARHVGLLGQVACKQQTRRNLVLVKVIDEVSSFNTAALFHHQGKAKPRRLRMGSDLRQVQKLGAALKARLEVGKVSAALGNEFFKPVQLGQGAGRLHVGDLEVVA